jgi:hypothetical protein
LIVFVEPKAIASVLVVTPHHVQHTTHGRHAHRAFVCLGLGPKNRFKLVL